MSRSDVYGYDLGRSPDPHNILFRCPKCHREKWIQRAKADYPEAARLEIQCANCNHGDFDEPMYYDVNGKHITRDPSVPPTPTDAA